MLVDTDVLIWHLRGLPQATRRLDQLPNLTLSAITWLELLQGFRSKNVKHFAAIEQLKIERFER